jgi:hypothetical protein
VATAGEIGSHGAAMSDSTDLNPYAPPQADTEGLARPARRKKRRSSELRGALDRLEAHLADAEAVAHDRRVAGPRFRKITWICGGLVAICLVFAAVGIGDRSFVPLLVGGLSIGALFAFLGLITLLMDLALVPRAAPATPDATLKSFFKALATGRHGYAWATLCPDAREQTVSAPSLGAVAVGIGDFTCQTEDDVKSYGATFARAGGSQMRTMAVKRVQLERVDGDVATVTIGLKFQSWPGWVTAVTMIGVVLFRPVLLLGAILYFVTRKQHEVQVTKTLLRGSNGAWYVYDADVLESAGEA